MTFVLNFSASKVGSTVPKYILMQRRLFRRIAMKQPIRPERNLRSSFQGAKLDPTIFKSFELRVCLSQNVDIIAELFSVLPAGPELKEKLVLLEAMRLWL